MWQHPTLDLRSEAVTTHSVLHDSLNCIALRLITHYTAALTASRRALSSPAASTASDHPSSSHPSKPIRWRHACPPRHTHSRLGGPAHGAMSWCDT